MTDTPRTPAPDGPRWEYQPASDHGLAPHERFRSVRREPGLLSWTGHALASLGLRGYLGAYHRLRVEGRERLPVKPPFVVIANHASHLDALILAAALPRTARACAYPVAAGDVFFTTVATSVLSGIFINALPLWRKKAAGHALDELRARLAERTSGLILFPEGARTRDGAMMAFKPGVGMLTCGTDVPVVPCYLAGAFEAMKPGHLVPRPKKIVVRVGKPLTFADLPNAREGWNAAAQRLRESVVALSGLT